MRAAIFVDGAYLLKQLQEARIAPDYSKLAQYFLAPLRRDVQLDLLRCYFYDCPPWMSANPTEEERRRMVAFERFVSELEDIERWQVRLGKLERRRDGDKDIYAQKRVDVQLSVDLVRHTAAGHIQHAVLVAGDSDFIPAVAAAKESGATLTLWCGKDRSPHKDLMLAADEVQFLEWRHFPQRKITARASGAEGARGRGRALVAVAPDGGAESDAATPNDQAVLASSASVVALPTEAASETSEANTPAAAVASNGEKKRRRGRRGGRGRRRGDREQGSASEEQTDAAPPATGATHEAQPATTLDTQDDARRAQAPSGGALLGAAATEQAAAPDAALGLPAAATPTKAARKPRARRPQEPAAAAASEGTLVTPTKRARRRSPRGGAANES